MFMIVAVIQPFRLEQVRSELLTAGVVGLTVCECVGHGRQPKIVSSLHGGPDIAELVPKVRIDLAVSANNLEIAIDAIVRGARLGKIGDGKIFVSPVEKWSRCGPAKRMTLCLTHQSLGPKPPSDSTV